MKNHSLKALSLAVATLLLQSQAQAAPTNAELNSVKLYGNVTIAQDSVTGWGPWTEFEPPAAGNPPLARLPGTSEFYRTLPQATTNLIGFSGYYSKIHTGTAFVTKGPNPITVTGTPTRISSGGFLPDSFVLQVTPSTAGEYPPPTSVALIFDPSRGVHTSSLDPTTAGETLLALVSNPDAPVDAQANQVSFYQLVSYIGAPEGGSSPQVVSHVGVIGYGTPAGDMAALMRGNVNATYAGHSLTDGDAFTPMTMNVQFGQGTWNAMFNNGANTTTQINNGDSTTTTKVAVGFSVQGGVINGSSFSTNAGSTFSATDGAVTGKVNGSFYGPQAAAVGGAYDVTKNGVRYVDPFIGVKTATPTVVPTPTVPVGGGQQ